MPKAGRPSAAPASSSRKRLAWVGAGVAAAIALAFAMSAAGDPEPAVTSKTATQAQGTSTTAEKPVTKPRPPTRDDDEPMPSSARPTKSAKPRALLPTPTDEPDPLRELHAAKADGSDAGTDGLIAELTSKDEVAVAEAGVELIRRKATRAIPALARIELDAAAGSGLSIIDTLGRLGGQADGDLRTMAVDRLIELLAEEKRRGAPESEANLLQIYEALGRTRDPRAAPPLEAELLDASVGRAPKVVIVQSILWIGEERSLVALEEARRQQDALAPADAFDGELRTELLGAIDEAIQLLR